VARLLSWRGTPRAAWWRSATASSEKRVSWRPARARWCLGYAALRWRSGP
jgi:hypothetical protein